MPSECGQAGIREIKVKVLKPLPSDIPEPGAGISAEMILQECCRDLLKDNPEDLLNSGGTSRYKEDAVGQTPTPQSQTSMEPIIMTQATEQATQQSSFLTKLKDMVLNTKFSSGVVVGVALTSAGIAGVKAYRDSKAEDETGGSGNQ